MIRPVLEVADIFRAWVDGFIDRSGARISWPQLKVIYSSGYTDSRLAGRGFDEDKVDLLRKPYTVDDLRRRVDQALG